MIKTRKGLIWTKYWMIMANVCCNYVNQQIYLLAMDDYATIKIMEIHLSIQMVVVLLIIYY